MWSLPFNTDPATHELLHGILKQVSRSFYLTLNVLPANVRDQMGLSYLFARAADTIADTDLISRAQRLEYLISFARSSKAVTFNGTLSGESRRLFFLISRTRPSTFCYSGWGIALNYMSDTLPMIGNESSG